MHLSFLKNKKITALFFISYIFILLAPFMASAQTGGLIPCEGDDCGTCEVVQLANNVVDIVIVLALGISVIIFIYAGWLLLSSAGNATQVKRGKDVMLNVLVGLIIILTSWLVIDVMLKTLLPNGEVTFGSNPLPWSQIACTKQRELKDGQPQTPGGTNWQNVTAVPPSGTNPGSGLGPNCNPGTPNFPACATAPNAGFGSGGNPGGVSRILTINPDITYTINDPADPSIGIMTAGPNNGRQITFTGVQVDNTLEYKYTDSTSGGTGYIGCALVSPPIPGCPQ